MNTRCLEMTAEVSNKGGQILLEQRGVLKSAAPGIVLDILHCLEQRAFEEVDDLILLV